MELIAVVMGATTSADRFAAAKSMLDYGFANFALYTPEIPEDTTVPVTLGKLSTVSAVPSESVQLLVEKSQVNSITTEIELVPSVTAPVSKGERLGTLTIQSEGQTLRQIPLVAESNVDRLTWGDITVLILRQIAMAQPSSKIP